MITKNSKEHIIKDSFEILNKYLLERRERWLQILNEDYKTDSGRSLAEHSKGRLSAITEFIAFINALEKRDEE